MTQLVDWFAGPTAALGAWLVAIPFVLPQSVPMDGFAFWNYLLVGAAIVLLSGSNWWTADERAPGNAVAAAASAVLGCWMIVAPYVTELRVDGWLLWNGIIVGAIVATLGAYTAYESREVSEELDHTAT